MSIHPRKSLKTLSNPLETQVANQTQFQKSVRNPIFPITTILSMLGLHLKDSLPMNSTGMPKPRHQLDTKHSTVLLLKLSQPNLTSSHTITPSMHGLETSKST
jgi:hypothetical protein